LNNVSEVDFEEVKQQLYKVLNDWLGSNLFRPIDKQLRTQLASDDELQVIFETNDTLLRQLPWHLWDFFEDYRHAEVGLSSLKYERVKPLNKKYSRNQVRILAVLGNSVGIDVQKDRKILEDLPDSSTVFLVEPSRQELDEYLWDEKGWDIFFFAGHSDSDNDRGKIHINQNTTLTVTELRNALKFAIARGLKLAIFNSCNGLGLTQQLADLQIPQIIVMRLNVPDLVAQEFLKYFLTYAANGTPFYLALRYARERLQGLEDNYPGVSLLPVVCQNPAEEPITWQKMKNLRSILTIAKQWKLFLVVLIGAWLTSSISIFLLKHLSFHIVDIPPSSFQRSCDNISIIGNNLSAECKTIAQKKISTTISVPGIRNINGNLTFVGFNNPSNFQDSNECKNIFINDKNMISGNCRKNDGTYKFTSIPLPGIHNYDGTLSINPEDNKRYICTEKQVTKHSFYLCNSAI
jgi:hypothetical protein